MDLVRSLEALHPTISKLVNISGSPGLSLGVLHHGEIIHTAHFGRRDINRHDPPNDDTIYNIGSFVKLLSASLIARLVQDGKLEWDTPIRQYLSEFKQRTDEIGLKTTVRDLLSMRTGLAVSHASFAQMAAEYTIARSEMLRTAAHLPAVVPFREQFIYSQWNYCLINEIVEEITGKSFGAYARQLILDRLKLDRTTFDSVDGRSNVSSAHAIRNDGTSCTILPPGVHDDTGFTASTGCKASMKDLLHMYQSFLSSHTHQKKYGINSTPGSPWTHTNRIVEPHVRVGKSNIDNLAYCLGLYRITLPANLSIASLNQQLLGAAHIPIPECGAKNEGLEILHHTAALPGLHGSMFLVPATESAVVVLTNSLPLVDPTDFTAQLLLSVLLDENPLEEEFIELAELARPFQIIGYERLAKALEKHKSSVPPTLPLERYEGVYHNALDNMAFQIVVEGDGLKMAVKGTLRTRYHLLRYDTDTFYWKADREAELCENGMWPFMSPEPHKIRFEVANGVVESLTWWHDPLGKPEVFHKTKTGLAKL